MKDYYGILGVPPDAKPDQIRDAYRKLAFVWHPDRNPQQREQAHERFLDLGEAYAVLKDIRQRRAHDRARPQAPTSSTRRTPGWASDTWQQPKPSAGAESPSMDDEPAYAPYSDVNAAATLRQYRSRVHDLARELASVDRPGRRVDVAVASLALVGLVTGLVTTAFHLIGLNRPEFRPPLWTVIISWMTTVVLATWFFSLRERRVERYVPYAEEVLERTGHGWRGPNRTDAA